MATIKDTVHVLGMISPTDTRDKYATHEDLYGKGGFRTLNLIIDLEKIPTERRKEGMIVYVLEDKQYYQLVDGIENENFQVAKFGGKAGGFVNVELLDDIPLIPQDERAEGMIVFALETKQYFQLLGGVEDQNFTLVNFGTGTEVTGPENPGDTSYIRIAGSTVAVGGAPVGTTFSGSIQDALDKILYPYVSPTFLTFNITGLKTSYEVGEIIPAGNYTFTWSYSNNSILDNSIIIYDLDNSIIVSNKAINPTNFVGAIKEVEFNTKKTISWKIIGKNSKGLNFEKLFSISSNYNYYFGNGPAIINEAGVKALTGKSLDGTVIGKTLTLPATAYKWICLPDSFIQPIKFMDNNTGFQVAMEPYIFLDITNDFGVTSTYRCYRTTNELAASIQIKIS